MPSRTDRSRWRAITWLLALLVPTLWLLQVQSGLVIDPTNQALKSPGTADAANARRLAEGFGSEDTVLLLFVAPPPLEIAAADHAQLDRLQDELRALPGVARVEAMPEVETSMVGLVVSVQDAAKTTADAVVALGKQRCPVALECTATGLPLAEAAIAAGVGAERSRMVPWIAITLLALSLTLYRHLGLALAVVLPAMLAILWLGGLSVLLGHRLDPIAVLLEPVVLTVGVAGSVHFVESFRRTQAAGHGRATAARRASRDLWWPAALTTGTTMLGLWSLVGSAIPAVADFGAEAAVGTALANALTFAVLPPFLLLFGPNSVIGPSAARGNPLFAARFCRALQRWRAWILGAAAAVSVFAAALLPQLRVDNDPLALLPADAPFRSDHDRIASRLGGVDSFAVLVTAKTTIAQPDRLLPFTTAMMFTPPAVGPAGPPLRAPNGDVAIPLRLAPSGSAAREALFDHIERSARELGLDGVVPAGLAVQIARDSGRLVRGQLFAFGTTLVTLGIAMVLGLRSVRLGLLALVPNVLPCLWLYGGLAALERPLSVATVMIGSVMLGLVVDNTIHLLHHYRRARQRTTTPLAVMQSLRLVGRPLWLSSLVLAAGFATGLLGAMGSTREFALLASATIGFALFGDALLLPALLLSRRQHSRPLASSL